ncbi:glycosyltransferase family 4 protein [Halopiger thermotolerans]
MSDNVPDVCVVTHPLRSAGENATRTLLEILDEITTVSLITAALPEDSTIRDQHTVIEVSQEGAGQSNVTVAAFRFLRNQIRMCRSIAQRDESVILFFGATSYVLPVVFARAIGKTVIVEPRGDVPLTLKLNWEQQYPSSIARTLAGLVFALEYTSYSISDTIVTYTSGMAHELGLKRFEHKLYPNGARYVNTNKFHPIISFRERPNSIGYVGRLDEEKGIRTLAEVAKQLPEDITFRFVGDGPLRDWLEDELSAEIERGKVIVTGWVDHDDVPRELNRIRLLVMPSQPTEGLPTTILEAMACGTPAYATPVSGVPDVARDGETGFLMSAINPDSIAQRIESILNRPDLEAVSHNAHTLIKDEYTFEAATERYYTILKSV